MVKKGGLMWVIYDLGIISISHYHLCCNPDIPVSQLINKLESGMIILAPVQYIVSLWNPWTLFMRDTAYWRHLAVLSRVLQSGGTSKWRYFKAAVTQSGGATLYYLRFELPLLWRTATLKYLHFDVLVFQSSSNCVTTLNGSLRVRVLKPETV